MTEQNELFKLTEKINTISFSEDTINFASNCLPLIKQFLSEIPNVKFNRTEVSVQSYNKSLKELGNYIINNYSDSLRLFSCLNEISGLFKQLEKHTHEAKAKQQKQLSIKEEISTICKRHYQTNDSLVLPLAP